MHPYIEIFGRTYPAYGSCIAAGAIMAVFIAMFLTRRKYDFEFVDYVFNLAWIFIAAMAGAKLLYLIVEIKAFIAEPRLFIQFIGGGGVFYGGLIGAAAGAFISSRIRKWNFIAVLDTLCAPAAFAHGFGRVGCFLAGCCFGRETHGPLGIVFPEGSLAPAGVKVLPTQLFEAVFLFLLSGALGLILWRTQKTGLSIGVYLTVYAVWRFVIEFFRDDRRGGVGMLSTSQFISLFIFAGGIALLIFRSGLEALFDKIKMRPTLKEKRAAQRSEQ